MTISGYEPFKTIPSYAEVLIPRQAQQLGMGENHLTRYKINQLTDTGMNVSLALSEDVELEPVSQQQMMLEAIDSAVTDKEVKEQIKPILEAILRYQPQTIVRTYSQTVIQITMPKRRYEKMGTPRVGDRLLIEIKKDDLS